jgi:hypothetical protein
VTVAAFLVLVAGAALVIHRLNAQHSARISAHPYSGLLSGDRHGHGATPALSERAEPSAVGERRDHRHGGRGRFPARRRRSRTAHDERWIRTGPRLHPWTVGPASPFPTW